MSENLPNNNSNEEIDLIIIFKLIGRTFSKFFHGVGKLSNSLFRGFIYLLKPIVDNIKLISIVVFAAAVLGFVVERLAKPVFVSDMLVKPYFDSKYQLANNVNYFNALIGSQNLTELSNVFEIDTLAASNLLGFEMEIGPETQNDLLLQYDTYIKSIDSTLAADVSYEEFIENRDILAGSIFLIKAKSSSNEIFPSLEKGFRKTFENQYSVKLKTIRDSTLLLKKASLKVELKRVDSLQRIYLEILKSQAEEDNLPVTAGGLFPLTQEKTVTREYDLFREELKLRDNIRALDEVLVAESEFFDILSGFEEVGTIEKEILQRYSIIFPVILLVFMTLLFVFLRIFHFIKNYE
jgi:hypothetical protein